MDKMISNFCERLAREHAPTFLFLGQNYLKLGAQTDVFLESIISKYDSGNHVDGIGYNRIFNKLISEDFDASRAWISDRANLLVTPAWLEPVAEYAWSSVITTSFDGLLNRTFRNEWRDIQPITSPDLHPLDPRNRTKLHVTYLYGSIQRSENNHASPLDLFSFTLREPLVSTLLQRLPEALTPFGTLVIEAYTPGLDWLQPKNLIPVLMALESGQTYLFSTNPEMITDPFLKRAIEDGKLHVFEQSLSSILSKGMELGIIPVGNKSNLSTKSRSIVQGKDDIIINEQLWSSICRFGTILDSSIPEPKKNYSPEKRYSEFRSFLAESGTSPIWSAFSQNLPFERDCEHELFREVSSKLKGRVFNADPILLHGQAGSGKTITLASIALKIHEEHKFAVVFIARRSQKFNFADLDGFCQWVEENGFPATLIVWDGMQEPEQYNLLHKYLLGRGRKFLLLGSSYKIENYDYQGIKLVLSPSQLSTNEIPRFKQYLSSFEPTLGSSLNDFLKNGDTSFLVALYRLLPESRGQVRAGLNLEAGSVALTIRKNAEQIRPELPPTSILGLALEKAGMLANQPVLPSTQTFVGGEWLYAEQELIGLILVPGQFGLQIPIEILLRTMSRNSMINFHNIMEGLDLFRLTEDSLNNILIGVRHTLEAKIISQARLGGPHTEIEYAIKLLSNVHQNLTRQDSQEVQFATDLVYNLGPKGPERKLYEKYYLEIANALTFIRENNAVRSPRLMLQESSLLREAIVLNLVPEEDLSGRLSLLERAQNILTDALEDISAPRKTSRLNGMLLNELASIYGTRAREYIRAEKPTELVLQEFYQAKKIAMRARSLIPEDFFPVDVVAWCTKDILRHADLKEEDRLDIIASIFNVFSLCDGEEINPRDRAMLHKRRLEFSELLGNEDLRQESLHALAKLGSTAGFYLQAVYIAGGLPSAETPIDNSMIEKYKKAISYLDDNYENIRLDGKCLYLYLRYWWSSSSKLPFFPKERTAVPFDLPQWNKALGLVENLITLSDDYAIPSLLYLQAICKWQLGYYDRALELWQELQRMSDRVTGRRRILKTYLSANAQGQPEKYHGTVLWVSNDGSKGEILVEGIRQRITFFPRDFKIDEIHQDEQISGFHIAFNYIAPTADPAYHYSVSIGEKR
ncbi:MULTISPECIES: P-loop NTPase [Aeromonas]|uniref:P-loop NTPase n=1 Tax=Aeromonas TaxID=642 RepID=UPI002B495582|nr:hypothetical protein [Aeromonas hydrophila]